MQNPYEKYKQQSVMTMTEGEMINLLFESAVNRLNRGILCLETRDYEGSNTAFKKAESIFSHLSATLDMQYDISNNLAALYDFFYQKTMEANVKKDPEPVREILPLVTELKESFVQADKNVRMQSQKSE